ACVGRFGPEALVPRQAVRAVGIAGEERDRPVPQRGRSGGSSGKSSDIRPKCAPTTRTVRSANVGVLAAVQLHDVGVVAARWLCIVGVLAAVQLHDTEAAPGDQLAQVPHPAYARD